MVRTIMSGDGLRSSEMPTTVALVLCGASFFFGYRFKGWVDYQTGQVEKFRQHVKSQARTYTFRAVELVTVAGIVFLTFRRLRN